MSFFSELEWRGLIQDHSDRVALERLGTSDSFYIGIDPTAPSLQVGNLAGVIVSMHLARCGLSPIILFGGATGSIGDPRMSSERTLMSLDEIRANLEKQQNQCREIWKNAGLQKEPVFVNNYEWTKPIDILQFLRDIGKHFTVNYMMAKDTIKTRLGGEGISYTEFSYMLLQALDFLHLYQNHGCKLQIGGADQWGNITAGLELIRRKIQGEACALTYPLITDSQGRKFGKSEGNAVWLNPQMTSPYKFHQFWLNTPDDKAVSLLKVFTFLSKEEVQELEQSLAAEPEKRAVQSRLADEICTLVHGQEATASAKACAHALFGGSLNDLSRDQLLDIFSDAPSTSISSDEVNTSDMVTLLSKTVTDSKAQARRLLSSGGVYMNNERISDEKLLLSATPLAKEGLIVLRSGKKNYHLVKVNEASS